MVSGYPNPLYPEHALMSMNAALLKEEKMALRKQHKSILDENDCVNPHSISAWMVPGPTDKFITIDFLSR